MENTFGTEYLETVETQEFGGASATMPKIKLLAGEYCWYVYDIFGNIIDKVCTA